VKELHCASNTKSGVVLELSWDGNIVEYCCLDVHVIASWNEKIAANSNACLYVQTLELYTLMSLNMIQCCTSMNHNLHNLCIY
jgi:hypothetical protein